MHASGSSRVHVDDRNLESARQAARIERAVRVGRIGREPDLVVRDDVNRAAGGVPVEPVQVERLGDDALAGKRRVAVNEDRQHGVGIERGRAALGSRPCPPRAPCPRAPDRSPRDGSGSAASRRRGRPLRRPRPRATRPGGTSRRRLHCTPSISCALRDRVLELRQDLLVRLAEHVRHHVQPAAMRHAR